MALERYIEVKGRAKSQGTITITSNKIHHGLNQKDKFVLAMVDGDSSESVNYVPMPIPQEPDWAEASKTLTLGRCWAESWSPRYSMGKQGRRKESVRDNANLTGQRQFRGRNCA